MCHAFFGRRAIMAISIGAVLFQLTSVWGEEASRISYVGYPDCIELSNATTRVMLCPAAAGRALEYSLQAKNARYLEESATGKDYVPGKPAEMSAGRFDIGPENTIPRHPQLWSGLWSGKITGPRSAILTSVEDQPTGTQLEREFRLAAE